jgi:3-phosphoshikimate 1-carboxyvinyltransferase
VRWRASVPGSKSIALRALVLGARFPGEAVVVNLPDGDDVRAGIELARALGARLRHGWGRGTIAVAGRTAEAERRPALDPGESGTLARFATAIAALEPGFLRVEGSGTLLRRTSEPLLAALERAGASFRPEGTGTWPLAIEATRTEPEVLELVDPVSSQEVSALLLAAVGLAHPPRVLVHGRIPSRSYLAITADVLARFHIGLDERVLDGRTTEFRFVEKGARGPVLLLVEPDASLAAVALAAACLSDDEARVEGFEPESPQGDLAIVKHLVAFGCEAERERDALVARGRPRRAAALDLAPTPDLAPVLVAIAAAAADACGEPSELHGLATLARKESDRIQVLARGLAVAGWSVAPTADALTIGPRPPRAGAYRPVLLDPAGDHRMAFAFALLGLVREGVRVSDPGCVSKTWPSFWEDFERAGVRVLRD